MISAIRQCESDIIIHISALPEPPSCPHHPTSLGQSAKLGSLCSNFPLTILHLIVYICHCYFLCSFHSLFPLFWVLNSIYKLDSFSRTDIRLGCLNNRHLCSHSLRDPKSTIKADLISSETSFFGSPSCCVLMWPFHCEKAELMPFSVSQASLLIRAPVREGTTLLSSVAHHVRLFATPWTAACQVSPSITNSQSLLKLMSIESVMLSKHLILCRSLLLLPSIFLSIRAFSKESVLRIRWPKYWSFSFSISPFNEYSELISFRID